MKLYAYTLPQVPEKAGWLKIGQTTGSIEKRINDQLSQAHLKAEIVLRESAAAGKNKVTDKEVHRELVQRGFVQDGNSEWFRCTAGDVRDALNTVKERYRKEDKRKELEQKFYEELRNWYYWATEEHRSGLHRREYDADHALRIIVRLLLIFFLKEKGLVPSELFQEEWLNANLKEDEFGYYNVILRNLFFHSLNTPHNERGELENRNLIQRYNKVKEALHKRIPFLNGGLFTEQSGDDFALNDDYFFSKARLKEIKALDKTCSVTGIIKILSQYKYTLDETDNSEFIDPEFVGNIFESLLACIAADKKKNRRKITGSYYTPREIVNYMVNEALDTYLSTQKDSDFENALLRCSILDPSCGSGAFPCGVMNVIMQRLDPNKTLTQDNRYQTKLKILRNVIYGIDIQPMAVHIASLRLFLSLLQEITPDKSKANFGIEPLPNLDYKFAVADTLFGIDFNDLFFNEHRTEFLQIQTLKADYFKESIVSAKEHLRTQITAAEKELADKSGNKGIQALCQWNHSDTQASPYFDSRWMFGIENFDIVIGNPPYGAKYPKEHKAYFLKHYESAKTADINENGT
ncbi:MAG: N-6 DNA methylase, partial [Planctomycetaceae bacterium]|nr:N-6 DNA methylase [Planctomycetaceae bacterium]